jgi:hypothetical protein
MDELPPSPLDVFWTTDYIPRWQLTVFLLWLVAVMIMWPFLKAYFNLQDRRRNRLSAKRPG